MQTQTEVTPIRKGVPDSAISASHLKKSIGTLVDLYTIQQEAAENYAANIKAVADKCGLLPAVVRRFVRARASENFRKYQNEVEQLSLVFEEFAET